jgi:O-antigen ligase
MNLRASETQPAGKHFLELSVLIFMFACLLVPNIGVGPDLNLPIEVLLLPVVYYIYLLLVCMHTVRPLRISCLQVFGACFSLSVLVSISYASTYLHHPPLIRDYYDVLKVWVPVLFFTLAYEADLSERALRRFLRVLGFATLLMCLYGWAQFLNVPGIARLNPYYSGGEHHDLGLEFGKRVYSTQGNPNVLGQFLSCALICYALTFLSKFGNRSGSAIVALAITSTLVLTGSRYALIISVFGLLLVLWLALSGRKRTMKLGSVAFLLVVLVSMFIATQKTDYQASSRFQELAHPTEVQSLRDRLDVLWGDAFRYFESSPVFGHGPAKSLFTGVWTDSEYLDVLKSYGMSGFTFYFAIHLWVLIQLWRGLRAHRLRGRQTGDLYSGDLFLVRLGFVFIVAGLAMNIGMSTYFNWRFSTFVWLLLGLAVRRAHTIERLYSRHSEAISKSVTFLGFSTSVSPL